MRRGERAVLGALAGLSATMMMTIAMRRGHAMLPRAEAYPLPPRELTERIVGPAGGTAAMLAHFAYGAAAGAAYTLMPRQPAAVVYGPLVWVASYLGWVPLTRRLLPATAHPAPRNLLMIGAHLVWGGCLGLFLRELALASRTSFGSGERKDAPREGRR